MTRTRPWPGRLYGSWQRPTAPQLTYLPAQIDAERRGARSACSDRDQSTAFRRAPQHGSGRALPVPQPLRSTAPGVLCRSRGPFRPIRRMRIKQN